MIDYRGIIDFYYGTDGELRRVLLTHSRSVADMALGIVARHPELGADGVFVEEAAMLHDVGIFLTNAPAIFCHGTEPYIRHGVLGAALMRGQGLERHARVCERHTGTGLTCDEIVRGGLPLPPRDFLPESVEEQIVCFADKFFSKTRLDVRKTPEQALRSIEKFGAEGCARFRHWCEMFG